MPYLIMALAEGTGAPVPYPDTEMLIHSNTTNGSTTFIDSSGGNLTMVAEGDAQHSTAQAKFGTSSIALLNGAGQVKAPENNAGFAVGTGDFTIDFWVYRTGDWNTAGLVSCMGTTGAPAGEEDGPGVLTSGTANTAAIYCYIGSSASFDGAFGPSVVPLNTWTHFAFIRASGVLYTALNGIVTNRGANTRFCDVTGLSIGNRYYSTGSTLRLQNTYMDEVRFSTTARWTSNFTPPTAPY